MCYFVKLSIECALATTAEPLEAQAQQVAWEENTWPGHYMEVTHHFATCNENRPLSKLWLNICLICIIDILICTLIKQKEHSIKNDFTPLLGSQLVVHMFCCQVQHQKAGYFWIPNKTKNRLIILKKAQKKIK